MAKLFLDKIGFAEYEAEILSKRKELDLALLEKSESFQGDTNTWHDNAAYDFAKQKEIGLQMDIKRLTDLREDIELVERGTDCLVVDIGDTVTAQMLYPSTDEEQEVCFLITADFVSKLELDDKIMRVSINSPVGAALYKKKAGAKFSYVVGDSQFAGVIKLIENPK